MSKRNLHYIPTLFADLYRFKQVHNIKYRDGEIRNIYHILIDDNHNFQDHTKYHDNMPPLAYTWHLRLYLW